MKLRTSLVKHAVLAILTLACLLGFWSSYKARVFADFTRKSLYNVTAYGGWFPDLSSRLMFGSPDIWQLPLGDDPDKDPRFKHSEPADDVLDPFANRVFLSLKTGADVMWDRLPIHLDTTFKRYPHHQIYADTETQIGSESVIDVIAMLPESLIGDIQLHGYRVHRDQQEETWGWDMQDIKQERGEGWDLDKFKNIPMLLHAYRNAPKHCDWFVFMDDDSYLHSQSLASLLRDLDPQDEHYIGSPALIIGGFAEGGKVGTALKKEKPEEVVKLSFAHGGSGIVLSRGAIDALFWDPQREEHLLSVYSQWGVHTCCGDALMAFMLRDETGLKVNSLINADEMTIDPFQGEMLENTAIPISNLGLCSRIVSWHHLKPWEIQKLFDWETTLQNRKANLQRGVLYSDFYHDFILPFLLPVREDWDNMASSFVYDENDEVMRNHELISPNESPENCEASCKQSPRCIGWKFETLESESKCFLEETSVRRGVSRNPMRRGAHPDYHVVSGWIVERLQYIRNMEACDPFTNKNDGDLAVENHHTLLEGWYFEELSREQNGRTDLPVF